MKLNHSKKQLTKLSNRIESLELMAFQDQISKLGDEVKSVNENITTLSRVVAMNELGTLRLHMLNAIDVAYKENSQTNTLLKEYIITEHAKAKEKVRTSAKPLIIFIEFNNMCVDCSEKYKLNAFTTKP